MAFSPDGKLLATGAGWGDNSVKLWDVAQRKELLPSLDGHRGSITHLAFTPDGSRLGTASNDGMVKLWDAATHQELASFEGGCVAFSPDGNILATGGHDGMVRLWHAPDLEEIDRLSKLKDSNVP